MKNIKILFLLFLLFCLEEIKAQLPNNDATFTQVALDDFNGSSINTASWTPNWLCHGFESVFDPANITVNGGYCKLKIEDLRPSTTISCSPADTASFRGANMISTFKFKYGYYEISAICPVGKGLMFAFWTYGDCQSSGNYMEHDIIEDNGAYSQSGTNMCMNYHWGTNCGNNANQIQPYPPPTAAVASLSNEHKFALFWEPDRITWYFDDNPVYQYIVAGIDAAFIIFDIDVETGSTGGVITATFPAYFQINYFKASQLQKDCSTPVTFCSNFNATTWNSASKVKKSITFEGSGCSDNINTSSNVNFWATDFVLLDEGTTITDDGSGSFMARVTACPN